MIGIKLSPLSAGRTLAATLVISRHAHKAIKMPKLAVDAPLACQESWAEFSSPGKSSVLWD